MYVHSGQKLLTYIGYCANTCARLAVRNLIHLTYPMPQGEGYWPELTERVKKIGALILAIPLAGILFIPSSLAYSLAACVGRGRFELLTLPHSLPLPVERTPTSSIKIMSLNACFQDPWSMLTGGVVAPFDEVKPQISRVAAIVNAVAKENPAVFLGQEFDDLKAQDECIRLMQQKGFCHFFRDLGSHHPMKNHSGLFIASKLALHNVEFIPYPVEDQAGLAKQACQGALTFQVSLKNQKVRLINVHLNYGNEKKHQAARNRQLKNHVIPLLKKQPAILFGDLNFDSSSVNKKDSGLAPFRNALEGQVTCTDAGKHTLKQEKRSAQHTACPECEERIDGLVYDPKAINVRACRVKPLMLEKQLLSDHYATIATLQIRKR